MDSIVAMPAIAIMMATTAITAQNIGAGKTEKIKEVFKWGVILNLSVILAISLLIIIFPNVIMHMFIQDPVTVSIGANYLRIVGVGYILFGFSYVSNGVISGAGKTIITMIISFISLCVIRIPLAGILSHTCMGLNGIWVTIDISFLVTAITSLSYYFLGRWKKSTIEKVQLGTSEV
jgi:Na+-driven multidrug efflux pump